MIGRPLMVMPFSQGSVARAGYGSSVVVRSITGNIDDAPQPAIWVLFEQLPADLTGFAGSGATALLTKRACTGLGVSSTIVMVLPPEQPYRW